MEKYNIATACWVPNMVAEAKFLTHLKKYQRGLPFYITTFGQPVSGYGMEVISVPRFGPFENPLYTRYNRPSDRYALWAFIFSALEIKRRGFEWMMWLETDCRVKGDNWDHQIVSASLDSHDGCFPPVIGGTPVGWHLWSKGVEWSMRTIDFAYRYQRRSGVPMQFEGAFDGPWGYLLYPNGAFGMYLISDLLEFYPAMFEVAENFPVAGVDMEKMAVKILAFDFYVGKMLVAKYGLSLLDRFAVAPNIYSGCGDDYISEGERITMLRRGNKVGIHQIKTQVYE